MDKVIVSIRFEARIWDKREHWFFDADVQALDETDAYKHFIKTYPAKRYTVKEVRKA